MDNYYLPSSVTNGEPNYLESSGLCLDPNRIFPDEPSQQPTRQAGTTRNNHDGNGSSNSNNNSSSNGNNNQSQHSTSTVFHHQQQAMQQPLAFPLHLPQPQPQPPQVELDHPVWNPLSVTTTPLPFQQQPQPQQQQPQQPQIVGEARARKQLDDAIKLIPQEEKTAYLEAMEISPELMVLDHDPLQFVRVCDYDIWAGAQRLCRYWTERKLLFGARAFLPLTITGEGALTSEDILCLQGGFPVLLPETDDGIQVMFADRRQYLGSFNTASHRIRCIFYLVKLIARDERAQSSAHGAILVILLVMPRLQKFDQGFVQKMWNYVRTALPIKLHVHCLCFLPKAINVTSVITRQGGTSNDQDHANHGNTNPVNNNKRQHAIQDLISRFVNYIVEGAAGTAFCDVEVWMEQNEPGKIFRVLTQQLKCRANALPESVGGNWKYSQAMDWCRIRAQEERAEDLNMRHLTSILNLRHPKPQRQTQSCGFVNAGTSYSNQSQNSPSGAATHDNLSSSATFPASSAAVPCATDSTALAVPGSNSTTGFPIQRLAPSMSFQRRPQQTDEELAAKRRATNAIHSRRKRERRRAELQTLKQESETLQKDNARLKAEHAELQDMIKWAVTTISSTSATSTTVSYGSVMSSAALSNVAGPQVAINKEPRLLNASNSSCLLETDTRPQSSSGPGNGIATNAISSRTAHTLDEATCSNPPAISFNHQMLNAQRNFDFGMLQNYPRETMLRGFGAAGSPVLPDSVQTTAMAGIRSQSSSTSISQSNGTISIDAGNNGNHWQQLTTEVMGRSAEEKQQLLDMLMAERNRSPLHGHPESSKK